MSAKPLRFWDLALYAVGMTLSLRWVATAAAAGPAALPLWVAAVIGFMAPLVIATAELVSRFEGEGGLYVWSREAFGPFAGFLCGWLYWTCNIPFFSGLLYFIVSVLGAALGPGAQAALKDPTLFVLVCLAISVVVAGLHLLGLGMGKWLSNFGGAAGSALLVVLVAAGIAGALKHGSATDFVHANYAPPLTADGAILWSTMVFAFGGPEALAFLRDQVQGGIHQILKVLAVVGGLLTLAYVVGTGAMLMVLSPAEATRLAGLPDALTLALTRIGLGGLAPFALLILALSLLGAYSAWFGVAARLPLSAGVDQMLPAVFARLHPRTGAPVAAILAQGAAVIVFLLLSQAGASLKAAYDFLVAMSVISYTLPFVFLFAVYLKVQGRPLPRGAWSPPGGPVTARAIGWLGLVVVISAILCTLVPSPDATNGLAAILKLVIASAVLILCGVAAYAWGLRKRALIAGTQP
ncbi:MAG: APC family permease [Caulobacteraceae bacterium]|nr:APC family permease [Caulobacteraceae bacterium]